MHREFYGGFDRKAYKGSFVFTAPDLEGWVERCNLTGFDPRGHMWIEENLPSCVRDTLLGEKGQDLLYCAVMHFFNVFQTEVKLHDKSWGKAFVPYILLALLYYIMYKQVYALRRCLEGELEVHAL